MAQDLNLKEKLQALFLHLHSYSDAGIEDDTVMQKLQSSIQQHIIKKKHSLAWCENAGLIKYISKSLNQGYISNEKNCAAVGFALYSLSSLVADERCFLVISDTDVINNFKEVLPHIRKNMSLTSHALKVVGSLITHSPGLSWVNQNGVWENLLIVSLTNQSIFVQKECVNVITSFLLNIREIKRFSGYICDLELILFKIREAKCHLRELKKEEKDYEVASAIAKLQFNSHTVLLVFHNLLLETLGKRSLYSELRKILDLTSKILFQFNFEMNSTVVTKLCKMLLLSTLHKFQGQLLKLGTAEQFHLDSVTSDILSLTKHMLSKGYHKEFLLALFSVHKYWYKMCKNIRERSDAEHSKCDSIVFVILKFQIIPLRVVCSSSRDMGREEEIKSFENNYLEWKKNFLTYFSIREEHQVEMIRLVGLLKKKFMEDLEVANQQCIAHFVHSVAVIDYLHPTCASTLFQVLVFALKFKAEVTSALESNPRFYLSALDCLRMLIERFEIDWRSCFEFKSLLPVMCSIVWTPGINSRVKVVTLQTINTCIARFMRTEDQKENSSGAFKVPVEKLEAADLQKFGETIAIFLSDTEWEVRDSAFEVIQTCLGVQKYNRVTFYNWFLKFKFIEYVLQALGDMEPYVQASSLGILASVVSVEEIWAVLENRGLKQKAVRAVVQSGESCVRKTGLQLIQSLLLNYKFLTDEVDKYVIPVVQKGTSDLDDEVRLAALKVLRQHLDMELMLMGMIDGEFPKFTFQCGKITNLEEPEVEKRVLEVICSFCQNGYFRSLLNCSDDNARTVILEANSILSYIGLLISKYNLSTKVSSSLKDRLSRDTSSELVLNPPATNGASNRECSRLDPRIDYERIIEEVLDMTDMSVISRLKDNELSSSNHWWDADNSETILKDEEIPFKLNSVGAAVVYRALENARLIQRSPIDGEDSETVIVELIDDIFLATGFLTDNESQSRDCY